MEWTIQTVAKELKYLMDLGMKIEVLCEPHAVGRDY